MENNQTIRFRGPNPGILAVIFTGLFVTGLSFVISFSAGAPHYPNPYESAATIVAYFRHYPHDAMMCSFFQFASAIPLGILTVTLWSRLKFLGVRAVGPSIALLGGLVTTVFMAIGSMIGWTMVFPGVAADEGVLRGLYYLGFALGGVGYSVPMGLLIAGIAVPSGFMRLLPRWMVVFGVALGLIGESSCLALLFPKLTPLIPLTRFPGFIWLMIAGFMLASRTAGVRPAGVNQRLTAQAG